MKQRVLLIAVSLVAAATRLLAIAKTPWDWDEMLFLLGMRDYDVAVHHPHPPGFPLYIAAARLVRLLVSDDFRALQTINVVAAMAIVPLAFFFCRELRLPFATSLSAASILAFLPNVWFFGGTAFSDVPSMVLSLAACALLLRGATSGPAFVTGAVVLAVAAGFRPQNLMIGAVPLLIAAIAGVRARRWGVLALALVTGAGIVIGSYTAAAIGSGGWTRYAEALATHREYIAKRDSFTSPLRPSLIAVADDFFVWPFRAVPINAALLVLGAISAVAAVLRRFRPILVAAACFLPFWIAAWLTLDFHSTSRFSIAWMPLTAILAADGIGLVAARRDAIVAALTAALIAVMGWWTIPALGVVRRLASPPVQAVRAVQADGGTEIYAHTSMAPYVSYFGSHAEITSGSVIARLSTRPAVLVTERPAGAGRRFDYPRSTLTGLVRERYFTVSVVPQRTRPRFGTGWYDEESDAGSNWVWMGRRSETMLPAASGGARLLLRFTVPRGLGRAPNVSISMNGVALDTFTATAAAFEREYAVARANRVNVLVVESDTSINPANAGVSADARELALRLDALEWTEVAP